jgi:hypothetical protein
MPSSIADASLSIPARPVLIVESSPNDKAKRWEILQPADPFKLAGEQRDSYAVPAEGAGSPSKVSDIISSGTSNPPRSFRATVEDAGDADEISIAGQSGIHPFSVAPEMTRTKVAKFLDAYAVPFVQAPVPGSVDRGKAVDSTGPVMVNEMASKYRDMGVQTDHSPQDIRISRAIQAAAHGLTLALKPLL